MSDGAKPFVLLLSGPSGAGKSVAAAAWAQEQPVPTAAVSHDSLRWQIRAGFASPVKGQTPESARQWDLAIDLCAGMVRRYLDSGVRCVIEAYRPPNARDKWDEELAGLDVRQVVLMPGQGVARARNKERQDPLSDADHERNYSAFEWSVKEFPPTSVIDNSEMTVAETVAAIDGCL